MNSELPCGHGSRTDLRGIPREPKFITIEVLSMSTAGQPIVGGQRCQHSASSKWFRCRSRTGPGCNRPCHRQPASNQRTGNRQHQRYRQHGTQQQHGNRANRSSSTSAGKPGRQPARDCRSLQSLTTPENRDSFATGSTQRCWQNNIGVDHGNF